MSVRINPGTGGVHISLMTQTTPPGPRTAAWTELAGHASRLSGVPTRELFERDPGRFARFSRESVGLLLDFSRQHFDEVVLAKLIELADSVALRDRRDAMWSGEKINTTEGRAVLHVALRQPPGAGIGGTMIERTVMAEREHMLGLDRKSTRLNSSHGYISYAVFC